MNNTITIFSLCFFICSPYWLHLTSSSGDSTNFCKFDTCKMESENMEVGDQSPVSTDIEAMQTEASLPDTSGGQSEPTGGQDGRDTTAKDDGTPSKKRKMSGVDGTQEPESTADSSGNMEIVDAGTSDAEKGGVTNTEPTSQEDMELDEQGQDQVVQEVGGEMGVAAEKGGGVDEVVAGGGETGGTQGEPETEKEKKEAEVKAAGDEKRDKEEGATQGREGDVGGVSQGGGGADEERRGEEEATQGREEEATQGREEDVGEASQGAGGERSAADDTEKEEEGRAENKEKGGRVDKDEDGQKDETKEIEEKGEGGAKKEDSEVDKKNNAVPQKEESDSDEEEEEEEDEDFPTTLDGFGYKFDDEGRLRSTDKNEPFVFEVKKGNRRYNQRHYEALGETITDYVYELLVKEANLKKVYLPTDAKEDEARSFFFMSEDALTNPDKLLILIHGSGVVRAGQWARSLIINNNLESGTQLPYIKRGIEEGYGVMVLNTNHNYAREGDREKQIKHNGSPQQHAQYVWRNFVQKSEAKRIDIVAHSFGGVVTVDLVCEFDDDFLGRVQKIAFTDSVHSLSSSRLMRRKANWLIRNAKNWVSSSDELDTPQISYFSDGRDIPRVSAGTPKHVETSWKSFESVFRFLNDKEEVHTKKKETTPKKKETTPKKKPKEKPKSVEKDELHTASKGGEGDATKVPEGEESVHTQETETQEGSTEV